MSSSPTFLMSSLPLKSWRSTYSCCGAGVVPMAALAAAATMALISISCIRMAVSWNVPSIPTPTSSRWKSNNPNQHIRPQRGRNAFLSATNLSSFGATTASTNNNNTTLCEGCTAANNHPDPKKDEDNSNRRSRNTSADRYFSKHGELPKPKVMHAVLSAINENNQESEEHQQTNPRPRGILVMGDVHGCFEEMQLLYQTALKVNHHVPFQYVILVGDLCNKGPDSAKVVRWVRQHQPGDASSAATRWLTVRGNHDDGALAAALGDEERRQKKKYQWVMDGEEGNGDSDEAATEEDSSKVTLSDDDVEWLSELPYTITIPGTMLGESFDTVVVHAGFIPRVELLQQTIETMITVREVEALYDDTKEHQHDILGYQYHERDAKPKKKKKHKKDKKHSTKHQDEQEESDEEDEPRAWAQVWKGPPRVIFGHDARRGLQQEDWAIGLDTGAVYGKQLTGIILPEQTLVSVDALKTHSPVASAGT